MNKQHLFFSLAFLLCGVLGCDAGSPPMGDGSPFAGACTAATAMSSPIAGCMPTPLATTGDPHQDCVDRINQFRCQCQGLPPLARWTEGEACADQMAQYDHDHPAMPHQGFRDHICGSPSAQNECPGWPSVEATVSGCLQQMWNEGPGSDFQMHGHYINMSNTHYSMVACGFYQASGGGVYALQNFQ